MEKTFTQRFVRFIFNALLLVLYLDVIFGEVPYHIHIICLFIALANAIDYFLKK